MAHRVRAVRQMKYLIVNTRKLILESCFKDVGIFKTWVSERLSNTYKLAGVLVKKKFALRILKKPR